MKIAALTTCVGQLPEDERMAVGRRAGDPADADIAGGAAHVLDDDGLAERRAHSLGQDAPDGSVGPPAGNGTTIVIGREG